MSEPPLGLVTARPWGWSVCLHPLRKPAPRPPLTPYLPSHTLQPGRGMGMAAPTGADAVVSQQAVNRPAGGDRIGQARRSDARASGRR
jgi:hypothetical protein